MKSNSLYDYPELYDCLRTPDQHTFKQVFDLITGILGRTPHSVMDPACGPATWLAHFARNQIHVAGNDICPDMIESAKKKCGIYAREFIVGDMCDLKFNKSPFDVTLEIAGTCGLLADDLKFRSFLNNVLNHTASGGLILLTIFFVEKNDLDSLPFLVDEWGPVNVNPNGQAWISYEVVGTEPSRSVDFVRRTVRTSGIDECPEPLIDEYEMFSWNVSQFWQMLSEFPQIEYVTSFRHDEPHGIVLCDGGQDLYGETTVVLKKNPEQ